MNPLVTARYGMMAAENRLSASASRVANWNGSADFDDAHEAVEQIEARQQFSASAKVARFAEDMWQSLLDIQGN
jgi:flagellar basal body rod protein FlgC